MLEPIRQLLKSKKIILASASPRRKEILEKNLGLNVEITPSNFSEDLDKSLFPTPVDYVLENSRVKTMTVAQHLKNEWFLIIGADTVVVLDGKIYEKPVDKEDAFKMLSNLNGKTHKVYTGVSLVMKKSDSDFNVKSFYEVTDVQMATVSDNVLKSYIESDEPLDKAGGYGIQGLGCSLISSINGDYFNVMGFPAHKFAIEFLNFMNNFE